MCYNKIMKMQNTKNVTITDIQEVFGLDVKTIKTEIKNPVKELFDYAKYRNVGKKILEKMLSVQT
jgi:hypothetical protein